MVMIEVLAELVEMVAKLMLMTAIPQELDPLTFGVPSVVKSTSFSFGLIVEFCRIDQSATVNEVDSLDS